MQLTYRVAVILLLLVNTVGRTYSQPSEKKKPNFSMRVHAGEPVPDMVFGRIKTWNNKEVRFSDFTGKLLILDFWTTNCAPCIAAMPKMEALQKSFEGKVQVILVTSNSKAAVDKLHERSKILQRNTLPVITDDTLLGKLFPYTGTPTHVWIGSDGKLMFVTGGYNTSKETVQKYFDGLNLDITHEEPQPGVTPNIATVLNEPTKNRLLSYSLLTERSKTTTQTMSGALFDTSNKIIGFQAMNTDVSGLIRDLLMTTENYDSGLYFPNRMLWEVGDSYPFQYPYDDKLINDWQKQYLYCYELKLSRMESIETIHRYVTEDIARYFGLRFRLENRKTKCLALVRTSSIDKLKTKGGKRIFYSQEDYSAFEGQNIRLIDFAIQALGAANYKTRAPVVDETNYVGNVDLIINADLHDLTGVRRELRKYDLDLVEKDIVIPMIVVTKQ